MPPILILYLYMLSDKQRGRVANDPQPSERQRLRDAEAMEYVFDDAIQFGGSGCSGRGYIVVLRNITTER